MSKTPGQIAYEAYIYYIPGSWLTWEELSIHEQEAWEFAYHAVEAFIFIKTPSIDEQTDDSSGIYQGE